MSLDLILGIDATGGECSRANQMVLWIAIRRLKSSRVGAFTWSSCTEVVPVGGGADKEIVLMLFSIGVGN